VPNESRRVGLVAIKTGMTTLWDDNGHIVPVTVLHVPRNVVVQVKTPSSDGYTALQVGAAHAGPRKHNLTRVGHLSRWNVAQRIGEIREFRVTRCVAF
jgi:large subunit ribosomal protein L3